METKSKLNILPVILSGGSGSRLWPLSRKDIPKQFAKTISNKSLFSHAVDRAKYFNSKKIIVISNKSHEFLVKDELDCKSNYINILEPAPRNTAAAMLSGALNCSEDEILLFMPSDHFIKDKELFYETVKKGVEFAKDGNIVVFGVKPNFPSTSFGYVQVIGEDDKSEIFNVKNFNEKPSEELAKQFLITGDYFWNMGIFLVQGGALRNFMKKFSEDIYKKVKQAVSNQTIKDNLIFLGEDFLSCRSESIDYEVLEKTDKIKMVEFNSIWSDVGNWNSLANFTPPDKFDNRVNGFGYVFDSKSTFIHSPYRKVIAKGTEDLIIADTNDALLVCSKNDVESIKEVVNFLNKENIREGSQHYYAKRPWGGFEVILHGPNFKVKRIYVNPGSSLSLQSHRHRAEHWVVVNGTAYVQKNNDTFLLNKNESTFIPIGVKHRLSNNGTELLEIIEVQSGEYLEEDDIQRYSDRYGR